MCHRWQAMERGLVRELLSAGLKVRRIATQNEHVGGEGLVCPVEFVCCVHVPGSPAYRTRGILSGNYNHV